MGQERLTVAPLVGEMLTRAQRRVLPALRAQVDRLPLQQRHWVAFHFGWSDAAGKPVIGARAGKGLRPALVYAAAEAAGGTHDRLDEVAAAVELVHNFCILHDDVIDQDRERRGRLTVWAEFGTSAGVLSGDAVLALALGCLDEVPLARRLCTAVQDLIRGEALDVEYETRRDLTTDDYMLMARLKTGSLMGAACALGAAAAGACPEVVARMDRFGRSLGLAFQIADDLLGIFGDPATTGKPVGADLRRRKWTHPVLVALASPDPAVGPLKALYRSTTPPTDEQVAECVCAMERIGARDISREAALAALADAEGHLDGAGLDPGQTAPLRAIAATVVDRSC
ncbi:polyprenyl synthetase family protein [Amycolatopsis sp. NPDC023774]|uniref:polyprenyl synthetase family protein n=1 Tax=Amycolatopsis sp. NPDC023774 TaxID=3155015 RepID=UPI003402608A